MQAAAVLPNHRAESLAAGVRRALIWRSGTQAIAQAAQWGATFLVIRLLPPADYGLVAMTQPVLVLLNMANGYGLASGLLRESVIDRQRVRQVFGMLLLLAGALALLQVAVAPLAARYFGQPAVATLLRVQAVLYLATPFIALPAALLSHRMDFRAQGVANLGAALAGAATALSGAIAGWGVWTLVAAPIALFFTRGALLTLAAGPLPPPSVRFGGAGRLARFGGVMALGQLAWFAQSQADITIGGRLLTPHALGLYTTALFLAQVFVAKAVPPLNEVAYAAYARLGAADAIGPAFLKASRIVMAAALPFYAGMAATAGPLVLAVLGPRWSEAVPLVRLLGLAMPLMTMQALLTPATDAHGRPAIGVANGLVGAALLAAGFAIGVRWGPAGLAASWLASYPLYLALSLWRSLPVIGVPARALAAAVLPALACAAGMGVAVMATDALLPPLAPALRLVLLVPLGGALYLALLASGARPLLRELIAGVRGRA